MKTEIWRRALLGSFPLVLAVAGSTAAAERVERHPLVDKSIEFHGGARYDGSQVKLRLCSASGCSRIAVRRDDGLYEHVVEGSVGEATRRVRETNDLVERWRDGRLVPAADADEERRLRDWSMARVYFCFLPFRLNDPGVWKEDLGLEVWEGRELRRIKVTFDAGTGSDAQDEYTYWFSPETGRVEMFAYSYESGGPGLRFRRGFNYRRVGGLLFFDQENWGVEGEGLSVDRLDPDFVGGSLRRVSTVELRDIEVEPVD